MNTVTLPQLRPGSTGDKAVRYLSAHGAATEAALCAAIDVELHEVRQLLAFPVRMGALAWDVRDGECFWRLGDGKPVEPPKAEPEAPAEPEIQELIANGRRRRWPGGYVTVIGSAMDKALCYLERHAPAGSGQWLLSRTVAHAADVEPKQIHAMLKDALAAGAVCRKQTDTNRLMVWQLGSDKAAEEAAPKAEAPTFTAAHLRPGTMIEVDAPRIFRCGIFSDGAVSIVKGANRIELNPDEALIVFEHLSAARRLGEAAR